MRASERVVASLEVALPYRASTVASLRLQDRHEEVARATRRLQEARVDALGLRREPGRASPRRCHDGVKTSPWSATRCFDFTSSLITELKLLVSRLRCGQELGAEVSEAAAICHGPEVPPVGRALPQQVASTGWRPEALAVELDLASAAMTASTPAKSRWVAISLSPTDSRPASMRCLISTQSWALVCGSTTLPAWPPGPARP